MKKRANWTVGKTIQMSPELAERVKQAADDRCVSINVIVNRALEEFLDRLIPIDDLRLTRDNQSEVIQPINDSERSRVDL
jgi:hypothetical protein